MIYGIGTDIVQRDRIQLIYSRWGGRFIQKILGELERTVFAERMKVSTDRGLAFLATRFAAKEACFKAVSLDSSVPMTWHALQILNQLNGRPRIVTDPPLTQWLERHALYLHISLSDEKRYAQAVVIAEHM